uniref:Uncharacterized protein n=1 Tax=Sciurus vulgaris TaxID=55149 RepID=A0A8D2DAV2_SCIVU
IFRTDTFPMALHSTAPFLTPQPSHLLQITFFWRASFLVAPLHKSSNITESSPAPLPLNERSGKFPLLVFLIIAILTGLK